MCAHSHCAKHVFGGCTFAVDSMYKLGVVDCMHIREKSADCAIKSGGWPGNEVRLPVLHVTCSVRPHTGGGGGRERKQRQ